MLGGEFLAVVFGQQPVRTYVKGLPRYARHRAVHELIEGRFGADAWHAIKADAGVDVETFSSLQPYPDDVTYRLVEAASRRLGLTQEALLEGFGEYWVRYTGQHGYGDVLKMSGRTLPAFLQNLDILHARVGRSFRELTPPSFECTDVQEHALLLHYRSHRDGLTPFVIGLIKGLGAMFNTAVHVSVVQQKSAGADHDVFKVEYGPSDQS